MAEGKQTSGVKGFLGQISWPPSYQTIKKVVHELITDNGQRDRLFECLRRYQSSQKLHPMLADLRQLLDEPDKLELYEFIRPLILLRHQMEFSYLAPAVPGVRLRTIRLQRAPGQSLGFAVRGGYEFNVGVFVSKVESGSQADKHGLKVGDEIVRVNGFTIAEAIHDDVLNLIKSRDEIVLKVTHIGMLPVKEHASDSVTWQYVDDMDSKTALDEVLAQKQVRRGRGMELKIFIDCGGHDSIGCGILSGPSHYPGIFVEKVRPGSLAEEAGLEVGDQIVEVNDTSFLNIGHKEAVVVLKGSKQLNVVVRKQAGLPLFERRQTPTRISDASVETNSQQATSFSTSSSQRSAPSLRQQVDSGLDEGRLIEEQLSRYANSRLTSSTSSPPPDSNSYQQSSDQVLISTQAEVHSDSDSYQGSRLEEPRVPEEEPPSTNSLTPPSPTLFTSTHPLTNSIVLPEHLGNSVENRSTPSPVPTSSDTALPLPDDLGDPVLAALRRPAYPPNSPPWILPHTHSDTFDFDPELEVVKEEVEVEMVDDEDSLDKVDENSNYVADAGQTSGSELKFDAGADGELSSEKTGFGAGSEASADSAERKSLPPVFVPPPPPSSPPPPTTTFPPPPPPLFFNSDLQSTQKTSPSLSRLSSTSTQTQRSENKEELETNFSDVGEIEGTSTGKFDPHPENIPTDANRAGREEIEESLPKLSEALGCSPNVWNQKPDVDDDGVGLSDGETGEDLRDIDVSLTVTAEVNEDTRVEHMEIHEENLPPPPAAFFEDDDDGDDKHSEPDQPSSSESEDEIMAFPPPPFPLPPPPQTFPVVLGGAAAFLAARREVQEEEKSPRLLGPAVEPGLSGVGLQHSQLAAWFNAFEIDGRELKAFVFPKSQSLGIEMEGGMGTPLAGRIVIAAVFDGGAAVEQGLQTGDQIMMVNNRKLTDVTVSQAEQILEEAYNGLKDLIQVVYAQSNFLNDEECLTYF